MIVMQEFRQHLEKATKGAFSRSVVEALQVGWFAIPSYSRELLAEFILGFKTPERRT